MRNDQDLTIAGQPDGDEALLRNGMLWIEIGNRQRVTENSCCIFKRDAVLSAVLSRLGAIPRKIHELSFAACMKK